MSDESDRQLRRIVGHLDDIERTMSQIAAEMLVRMDEMNREAIERTKAHQAIARALGAIAEGIKANATRVR